MRVCLPPFTLQLRFDVDTWGASTSHSIFVDPTCSRSAKKLWKILVSFYTGIRIGLKILCWVVGDFEGARNPNREPPSWNFGEINDRDFLVYKGDARCISQTPPMVLAVNKTLYLEIVADVISPSSLGTLFSHARQMGDS